MNNHYHIFSKYINPCRPSKHAEPTQSVGARLVVSTIAAQAGKAEGPRAGKRHWINPSTLEVIQYLQVTKPHHYFKCQNFQQVMSPMSPATDTTDVKKSVTLTGPNYAVWYLVTWARLLKKKLLQVIAHIAESAPAAVAADGADDKTDDPLKKKKATAALCAAPPTISYE